MSTWRLRTSLSLLLVATTAATFTLIGAAILATRLPQIEAEALIEVQTDATDKARLLEFYLAGIEAQLVPLADLAEQTPATEMAALLRAVAGNSGKFVGLYLADRDGIVRAATVPHSPVIDEQTVGNDLSRTPIFRDLGDQAALWSDKHLSAASGEVVVGVGVRRGRWTVIGEIGADLLRDTVTAIAGSSHDRILVVDRLGEWIADGGGSAGHRENLGARPAVRTALDVPGSGRVVSDGAGSQFVGSARPQNLGWTFIVTRPAGLANPEVQRILLTILGGFVGALAIGFLIAPGWARQLTQPTRRLIERTHLLAAGRYDDAAALRRTSRISELNDLDRDLQTMADAIRQRERSLADSEERLRATIENTPTVAIQWFDREGICRYWNPASTALYGYTPEETVGRSLGGRLFSPAQADDFLDIIRQIDESGTPFPTVEFSVRHKDGSERIVLCSVFAIPDGAGGRQYVCLDVDITDRKRAESALRAREKELESIFNASPAPMSVSDAGRGFRVEKVNDAWVRQFGWTPEQALGQNGAELGLYADAETRQVIVDRLRYGPGIYDDAEVWLKRADGSQLLCIVSTRLIEVSGQLLLLMVSVDITEERRMATELRHMNEELETRVEQRTALLSEANSELEAALSHLQEAQDQIVRSEKLAALGRLVAGVAHELNTPIGNGLMAVSTLEARQREFREAIAAGLKRSTLEQFVEDVGKAAEIATRNLNRAGELIASFKQVAVDQTSSQRRRFRLARVVEEILVALKPVIAHSGHRLDTAIDAGIELDSFPGPLGQALGNLVENALTHAFDGRRGGRIVVAAEPADGTHVRLSVSDDGRGIADDHLAHVFDPFFTTCLGQGGSGLGLHIVYNIVTGVLGGSITADTPPGGGARFVLTLPLTAPAAEAETATADCQ